MANMAVNENKLNEASNPTQLAKIIDQNKETWEEGRKQLYNGCILAWLRAKGHQEIIDTWAGVADKFKDNKDAGLEAFLQLMDPNLRTPQIEVKPKKINILGIQPGQIKDIEINVANWGRGHVTCNIELTPAIPGVSVSPDTININEKFNKSASIHLKIDTTNALKGKTELWINTNAGEIKVPVSYQCVFPSLSRWHKILTWGKWVLGLAILALIILRILVIFEPGRISDKMIIEPPDKMIINPSDEIIINRWDIKLPIVKMNINRITKVESFIMRLGDESIYPTNGEELQKLPFTDFGFLCTFDFPIRKRKMYPYPHPGQFEGYIDGKWRFFTAGVFARAEETQSWSRFCPEDWPEYELPVKIEILDKYQDRHRILVVPDGIPEEGNIVLWIYSPPPTLKDSGRCYYYGYYYSRDTNTNTGYFYQHGHRVLTNPNSIIPPNQRQ